MQNTSEGQLWSEACRDGVWALGLGAGSRGARAGRCPRHPWAILCSAPHLALLLWAKLANALQR